MVALVMVAEVAETWVPGGARRRRRRDSGPLAGSMPPKDPTRVFLCRSPGGRGRGARRARRAPGSGSTAVSAPLSAAKMRTRLGPQGRSRPCSRGCCALAEYYCVLDTVLADLALDLPPRRRRSCRRGGDQGVAVVASTETTKYRGHPGRRGADPRPVRGDRDGLPPPGDVGSPGCGALEDVPAGPTSPAGLGRRPHTPCTQLVRSAGALVRNAVEYAPSGGSTASGRPSAPGPEPLIVGTALGAAKNTQLHRLWPNRTTKRSDRRMASRRIRGRAHRPRQRSRRDPSATA